MKNFSKILLSPLFDNKNIRKKVIFFLKNKYFHELDFSLDLGWGFRCPIYSSESRCSFSEIFFQEEYKSVFADVPLPNRWLDLGCHYGYFSLYIAWLRAKQEIISPAAALLLDADSRVLPGLQRLINLNHLGNNFKYMHGAISQGSGEANFIEQEFMSSSLYDLVSTKNKSSLKGVSIVEENTILRTLQPPYDLVKIDIEGGEYDFLLNYGQVLRNSNYLLLEWHSWHRGGGSASQIQKMTESYGFRLRKIVQEAKSCGDSGCKREVGVFLFQKILSK